MPPTTTRIYNFSAGPAVLPLPVLEEAQRDLIALPDVGMSVMEISHRSKTFEDMLNRAIEDIRALAGVPANYKILMLQGGATLQFSMVPMNLLGAGATADYIDTGSWADKAIKEAKKVGTVNIAGSTKTDNYTRIPAPQELKLTPGAAYVHITTNNTIEGTEWKALPDVGSAPLVADTSSDMFSGPIDVGRFGLIYAGAQKNLGPSGVTLVIIREDLIGRGPETLPIMMNYKVHAENNSLYNTPNTFGIYILGLTVKWLKSLGGLQAIARVNQRKAATLYAEIDRTGFYRGTGGQPVADERDVPAGDRGAGETVCEGINRRRARRAQGTPRGRRHARLDLQRVSRRRRRRARRVHEGVRTEARIDKR
jgi:phosphoserine aminotransferase